MSAVIYFVLLAAGIAAVAYNIGWKTGRQHGRDEQWADDFIAKGRADAARRDSLGRFRQNTRGEPRPSRDVGSSA